jgi:hypothetical protein
MSEHYTINHFSLNLPATESNRDNIPNLLRHLATTIEAMDEGIEIQDIVFNNDIDDGKACPGFTVYYNVEE